MKTRLSDLVDETVSDIRQVLHRFGAPAVMSSFGKDSIAMLHCIREAGFKLPVIYWRDPWQPHKHVHANEVITAMGLTVHTWPPTGMGVRFNGERLEFVARYQVGRTAHIDLPNDIEPEPDGHRLCGLYDIIRRPISVFRHGWDLILMGHKSSDKDEWYGNVPLHIDIKQATFGDPAIFFPLRNWTDDDVWDLIETENLPFQKNRYQDRVEVRDKTFNNDYVECCAACLNPNNGKTVFCPRFNKEVDNAYELVPHFDQQLNYFGEEKPCPPVEEVQVKRPN